MKITEHHTLLLNFDSENILNDTINENIMDENDGIRKD